MIRPGDVGSAWVTVLASAGGLAGLAGALLGIAPLAGAGMAGGAARVARSIQREQPLPGLARVASTLTIGAAGGVILGVLSGVLLRRYLELSARDHGDLALAVSLAAGYLSDYLFDGAEGLAAKWKRDPLGSIGRLRGGRKGESSDG